MTRAALTLQDYLLPPAAEHDKVFALSALAAQFFSLTLCPVHRPCKL